MKKVIHTTIFAMTMAGAGALSGAGSIAMADGMIAAIVNAPLSATGTLAGSRVGINVYLQKPGAVGADFMDPAIIGFGIPKGGRLEVELGGDFERDWQESISQSSIMLVTGAPQQGLPGKKVGYTISTGANDQTYVFTPAGDAALVADTLMSPAPGAKADAVRQRGIKVVHIGFLKSAFFNNGESGTVTVRLIDGAGKVIASGSETIKFLKTARAQILPTNFPHKRRNHNWQTVKPGEKTGLPLTFMLYGKSIGTDTDSNYAFRGGMEGVGFVAGSNELFKDGLLVRDSNGDGKLDAASDTIVGGVNITGPQGATGQSMYNLSKDGKAVLSIDTVKMAPKPGKRWGGSMLLLGFKAGSTIGKYRAAVSLLNKAGDVSSGKGASYTYTIVAK